MSLSCPSIEKLLSESNLLRNFRRREAQEEEIEAGLPPSVEEAEERPERSWTDPDAVSGLAGRGQGGTGQSLEGNDAKANSVLW